VNYKVCTREKDIMSIMWNVFVSFGYKDAVVSNNGIDGDFGRFAVDEGLKGKVIISGTLSEKAKAELVSVAVEASVAADVPEFSVELTCSGEAAELIELYSIDEYCSIADGSFSFIGKSGDLVIFRGNMQGNSLVCEFDFKAVADAVYGIDDGVTVPETIIYSEKDAEGIGYEIAYTMRLSGCLVTNYIADGNIGDCEAYAKKCGAESIIRAFPDGKIQIKEMATGEITETDYNTFVGYYDDEPEEHHHHHGDECDCGHCH